MFVSQTSGILVCDSFIMFYPIRCHLLKQNHHPFLVKLLTQPPLKHPATPGRSKHNSFHGDFSTKAQGDRNEVGTEAIT